MMEGNHEHIGDLEIRVRELEKYVNEQRGGAAKISTTITRLAAIGGLVIGTVTFFLAVIR
jgi:hypothetical protein